MPYPFQEVVLGNAVWRWAAAVVTLLLAVFVLRLVVGWAARRLANMSEEVRAGLKDLPFEVVSHTKVFFYLAVGLWLGSLFLVLPADVDQGIRVFVTFAVFLQVGIWAVHLARELVLFWLKRRSGARAEAAFEGLIGSLTTFVVWVVVFVVLLENLGVDVAGLIAALGIVGIGVGMAAKDVFSDLFASLSIALDKPFEVGDFLIFDGNMGTVERIGIKTTRIRSLSGEQLVVGNGDLLSATIRNYKRMQTRRIVFAFGIEYGTPAEKLEEIPGWVRTIVEKEQQARFDRAHFKAFGDSTLDFEVVYVMQVADYNAFMDVQQRINLALYRKLEEQGIAFAFPTRTIHVASEPSRGS